MSSIQSAESMGLYSDTKIIIDVEAESLKRKIAG